MSDSDVRQIVYTSKVHADFQVSELGPILFDARFFNRRNEVTGLLLFDGKSFIQALEGEWRAVGDTFSRIAKDSRHRSIVKLCDRATALREFGNWDMATKVRDAGDYSKSVLDLVYRVTDPEIKLAFERFAGEIID